MKSSIIVDPDICNGKPIIAGARISVQTVMEFLAAGDSIEEILEEYPALLNRSMKLSFAYIQRPLLVYVLKMASLEIHTANQQRRISFPLQRRYSCRQVN